MKHGRIFFQDIWLVNTLRASGRLTLGEINRRWVDEAVGDGYELPRSSFNRHRAQVAELFGIDIECESTPPYRYYIANPDALDDDALGQWLLTTLTVGGVLWQSMALRDRIVLEDVPGGVQYLSTIISAIRERHKLLMGYGRFGHDSYEVAVCPYAIKLCAQRWYMLAYNGKYICTYALDRITTLQQLPATFKMKPDFSARDFYHDYYGVLADETPIEHVVVRAFGTTGDYLRTLPLHHSQRELGSSVDDQQEYTDFALDICPTYDFQNALLALGENLEVLEPQSLRNTMRERLQETLARYSAD